MLYRLLLTAIFAAIFPSFFAQSAEPVPAFPGAEGYARYTTRGGRGKEVYHVTTLADNGPGSFRDAVSQGNRTIVFDVGGYIDLDSAIMITANNITIAGQTAPGDGITLRYHTLVLSSNNLIVRFLRVRRSQLRDVNDGADAIWGRRKRNIILDHCSFSWSIDEIASFYDNANFTMQWCMMGEALANPGHTKGEHSYGGIWGGKGASFHHNFLCHMQNRMPRFNGARYNYLRNLDTTRFKNPVLAERVDFRNCVMYNWGWGGSYGGPGGGFVNMVNNYYKAGPGTLSPTLLTMITVARSGNAGKDTTFYGLASRYYIDGNYMAAADKPDNFDWKGVVYDFGLSIHYSKYYIIDPKHYYGDDVQYTRNVKGQDCVPVRLDAPVEAGEVTTHTAKKSFDKVLQYAGASLTRDAVDDRYVREARSGTVNYVGVKSVTAGIVDSINALGAAPSATRPSFPELRTVSRPANFDTDGDGMPDVWETANKLDPKDPSDGKERTLDPRGWYTNLEVYLNSLVEDIVRGGNAGALSPVKEYYPKCKRVNLDKK